MSKMKNNQEINDFWSDCLKDRLTDNKPSNNIKNLKSTIIKNNHNYLNKGKRNKKIYQYNTKPISFRGEIIKQDLLLEENNKSQHNKKK